MSETDQPNIVVFWGDDVEISNLSCYFALSEMDLAGLELSTYRMLQCTRLNRATCFGR
ncbi:MAG TPA: hypothetical protein VKG38_19385 [Solirubrobacteraceae bacterium]|nr:hypothetical protein [Solirubrobacteraceae bacterium]